MTQLVELHGLLPAPLRSTTRIAALSADPPDRIRQIEEKVTPRTGAPFAITLLSDPEAKVIRQYGLLNAQAAERGRLMPHPTTFVIDSRGVVRWRFTEVDYKVRPENRTILAELEKLRR